MAEFGELLKRARRGEGSAQGELVEQFLPELRGFIRLRAGAVVRAKESQSDLVQTVCLQALADLGDYRGDDPASFKAWLFTTALHKIIAKGRHYGAQRRDARRELAGAQSSDAALLQSYASFCTPSKNAMAREEIERIEAAFDDLPEDYREVIALSCFVGLSHAEIAEKLGRTEQATRHLLSRARARLAMRLMP